MIPVMVARRVVPMIAALAVLAAAAAQQPLNTPNYFMFQLPRLELGVPVDGELTFEDGQNFKDGTYLDMYVVEGLEGEHLSLHVRSGEFDPYVTLYDPEGFFVAANDDFSGAGTDAGIEFTLYMTGRYLVVVSGYSQWDIGRYVIERSGASSVILGEPTLVALPSVIESMITSEMPALPGGWAGSTEYFTFEVEQPIMLVAFMASDEIDSVLTLYDAAGNEIAQNDDHNFSSNSQIAVELSPGSYVLAASSYYAGVGGRYQLELKRYVEAR